MDEHKTITVDFILGRDNLLYDIANEAYIEGDLMPDEADKVKAILQDLTQDGNIDKTNRTMNIAVSECEEMLYPYTNREIQAGDIDNRPAAPTEYHITARFPDTFSQTTADLLKGLLHEYVVGRVLADWLGSTKPEIVPKWLDRIGDIRLRIKQAMSIRRTKTRRKISPL